MFAKTLQTQGNRYGGNANGKCVCLSFPAHEIDLIDDLDFLAELECVSRSQYVRRFVRREKQKVKEQMNHSYMVQ